MILRDHYLRVPAMQVGGARPASGQSIASDIVRADEPLLASVTRRNLLQTVRADWDYRFARYMNEDPDRSCIYPEVSRVHHTRTPQERAYSTTDTLQADRYAPMAFAGHMDTDAAAPALPADQEAAWALRPDDFEHLPLEAYEGDIRRRLRASTQIGRSPLPDG